MGALLAVGEAAVALLDLVVATAAEEDVDLPARRYVTSSAGGGEAWDCEQVVVALLQLNPASAGSGQSSEWIGGSPTAGGSVSLPELYLQVQIVRPIPVLTTMGRGNTPVLPKVDDEHAAGLAAMQDAALLHRVRAKIMRDASLTGGDPGDVRLGPITPVNGEGGLVAMTLIAGVTLSAVAGS